MEDPRPQLENIFFAQVAEDIVVLRIEGKGSHLNSPAIDAVVRRFQSQNPLMRFVIDLELCPTMDSTFLGVLAGIALRQLRSGAGKTVAVNAGEQALRLIDMLGLRRVLDARTKTEEPVVTSADYEVGRAPMMAELDRTIHMIQAHEQLVSLDTQNEVKFEGVLKCLRESLERQTGGQEPSPK